MSLARRLSSIRVRNPFRRQSKATKSRSTQSNVTRAVIEDREEPPSALGPGNEDESHYKPLKSGPKRKTMCFCCEKRFTTMEKFLSLGIRKCVTCHRNTCKKCVNPGGCHVCAVKRSLDLNPQNLMQVEAKELVAILNTLHFADVNFINWPKEYLIKQLFTRLDVREDWNPAEARTYPSSSNTTSAGSMAMPTENTDLNESEDMFKGMVKEEFDNETVVGKQAKAEESCCSKSSETPEESESSKLEQVRQKRLQDPASKNVAGIPNEDLCKICMDFPVNCILLNCGHLVVCIYCSDLIQECPICRKTIERVIEKKLV